MAEGNNGDKRRAPTVAEATARLILLMNLLESKTPKLLVQLSVADIANVIGQLQIALEHPNNIGPAAKGARQTCDRLIGILNANQVGLGETLALGYIPGFKWGLVPIPEEPEQPPSPIISTEGPKNG